MIFRAGQKVECIHAGIIPPYQTSGAWWDDGEEIVEGAVYTIHSTFFSQEFGVDLVRLMEVKRTEKCQRLWGHDGYAAMRFRPLVERKTDIDFAHEILRKASQSVKELG